MNTPISSLPGEKPYEGFWLLDLGVNRLFYVTAERGDICGRGTLGIENALDPALCSGMTSGDILISRIVRSLLYALRWKQIIQQTEVMPPSLAPNASRQERREHERAEAKGKSFEKYTILSLSKNDRTKTASKGLGDVLRAIAAHIVMGHWHHYWVREPKDGCVVRVNGKGLSLVAKWILPYVRGTVGEVAGKCVEVRA